MWAWLSSAQLRATPLTICASWRAASGVAQSTNVAAQYGSRVKSVATWAVLAGVLKSNPYSLINLCGLGSLPRGTRRMYARVTGL